jgi:uncharacterized repeat protein (TIGR03803 family)
MNSHSMLAYFRFALQRECIRAIAPLASSPLKRGSYAFSAWLVALVVGTWGAGFAENARSAPIDLGDVTLTKLVDLDGALSGGQPRSGLTLVGNELFLAAYSGGKNGVGAISKYNPQTNTLTKLADLDAPETGGNPSGRFTQVGDKLYFTNSTGGQFGDGTIAAFDLTSGSVSKIADLKASETGKNPLGDLLQVGTDLYFTASAGLSVSWGALNKLNLSTGSVTVAAEMSPLGLGRGPNGSLTRIGDDLYFATREAGPFDGGAIVRYELTSGTAAVLGGPDTFVSGRWPEAGLTIVGDFLYFTNVSGGPTATGGGTLPKGTLARIYLPTGEVQLVYDLIPSETGKEPRNTPIQVGEKLYFAVTEGGQSDNLGTLLRFDLTSGNTEKIFDFVNATGGESRGDFLRVGNDLYFTTSKGGAAGVGTIAKLTVPEPASWVLTVMGSAFALLCIIRRRVRA